VPGTDRRRLKRCQAPTEGNPGYPRHPITQEIANNSEYANIESEKGRWHRSTPTEGLNGARHRPKVTQATQGTQSPKKSRITQNTQTSNRKKVGGTDRRSEKGGWHRSTAPIDAPIDADRRRPKA
jgi:hypothetical protein